MIEKDEEHQFETPEWLEKRHEWNKALEIYSDNLIQEPSNPIYQRGKLRCLKNLFDWENLSNLVGQMWDQELKVLEKNGKHNSQSAQLLQQIAYDGLESSWNLGDWTDFSKYIKVIKSSKNPLTFDKCFYQAILEIKNKRFPAAHSYIEKARQILDPQITSLLGESYGRAYSLIQDLQSLKELEEVINYVKTGNEQRRKHIYSLWQKRFMVQPSEDLRAFQRSLNLRSIVIDRTEEVDQYIQFAQLAQNSGNPTLGSKVLNKMLQELISKMKTVGSASENS
jgi:FKBP12-rapamycin complex-associated protein